MDAMTGKLVAVCVMHDWRPNPDRDVPYTAIDKRPVAGPVRVHPRGLEGDDQGDRKFHGGRDQAVYAYTDEDAAGWAHELGRDVPPGSFGENLRTQGLDINGAEIGEQWRVGSGPDAVLLEVTAARTPCGTFQHWMGEPHWIRRFTEHGSPGTYLRVLVEGSVRAGDPVMVEYRPGHGVTVAGTFGQVDAEVLVRLRNAARDGRLDLHSDLRRLVRRVDRVDRVGG
jgi:MOSC domain-containing protein YiiM